MGLRRLTFLPAALAVAASCNSRDAGSGAVRSGASTATAGRGAAVVWFDGVEPLLLAPAHSNDRALVVAADSTAPDLEDGALRPPGTLVRLDGTTVPVRVSISSSSEGCVDASLQPAPAEVWGVGFVGTAPTSIPVDSLRAITRADSLALAPVIFRMSSSVPNTEGGRFAGLPFSLVDLWRIRAPDGAIIVVATTKRQINQEDSPLEERTLLVAESDATGALSLVHSARSAGPEETVEGSELLAAVSFGPGQVQLILSHDYGDETAYAIVERLTRGSWKLRWASRRFSC
jgi:hypothetical protein